jgi:SAM-dependent methyltransferase
MAPEPRDSTRRFSNRVENYIAYRPHYPREILECLRDDCGLNAQSIIADIGSGTGILSELFLANGNHVFGVEPNLEMREAGERLLGAERRFTSIAATAEATTLSDRSVDFVTAGQAFHWFDPESCRKEFRRILRPNGWVVLIWNDRRTEATPFLKAYEQLLLAHATDYEQVNHKRIDTAALREFLGAEPVRKIIPNYQHFDLASLRGRLMSSSYVPDAGQPGQAEMMEALNRLFESHQEEGRVTFEYDTLVYYGRCIPA